MAVYLTPVYCIPYPRLLYTLPLFTVYLLAIFFNLLYTFYCKCCGRILSHIKDICHKKLAILGQYNIKKVSKAKSKFALLCMVSVIILFVLITEKYSQLFSLFCLHIINFKLHFVNFALILACCIGYGIFYGCFSFFFGSS